MDPITVNRIMGEELVSRGLASADEVAADHAVTVARLSGETSADHNAATLKPPNVAGLAPNAPAEGPDPLWAGPDSPAGYRFDAPLPAGQTPDLAQERVFREFFHEEGVPVGIARELNRLALQGSANPPSLLKLELDKQQGMAALDRIWGPDREANLAIAKAEFARMAAKRPEIVDIMVRTGLGNSPWVIQTLVNMARGKGRVQ